MNNIILKNLEQWKVSDSHVGGYSYHAVKVFSLVSSLLL